MSAETQAARQTQATAENRERMAEKMEDKGWGKEGLDRGI